ncbi:Hypothetical protein NTJ_05804 [Nesidiocoris tenuis]|uniref:Uncharacterized protein n=1 Tax=Nesidiocoris tenuis TaxID=355587 RepID=A0ABN7AL80_9HEMI|nr:Hypothetical protein NTJ_05804 [Nesidiocoris tenuis]
MNRKRSAVNLTKLQRRRCFSGGKTGYRRMERLMFNPSKPFFRMAPPSAALDLGAISGGAEGRKSGFITLSAAPGTRSPASESRNWIP